MNSEFCRSVFDGCSGVSSSASGEDMFSAPEEKSRSILRGVVKAGWPKIDLGGCDGGSEKRKGCEFGSRRDGVGFFVGESNTLWVPGTKVSM